MKKKQVLLVMLVLLLALSSGFFSCKEDDGDVSLVGTWECKMTKAELAAEAEMPEEMIDLILPDVSFPVVVMKMVFTETTWKWYGIDPRDGTEELLDAGTYTVEGSTVTDDQGILSATISGNKLIAKDEEGKERVLTKK